MIGLVKIAMVSAALAAGCVSALESGRPPAADPKARPAAATRAPALVICREAAWPYDDPACRADARSPDARNPDARKPVRSISTETAGRVRRAA